MESLWVLVLPVRGFISILLVQNLSRLFYPCANRALQEYIHFEFPIGKESCVKTIAGVRRDVQCWCKY